MIFNEIYSAYYNCVAKIIAEILKGNRNEKELNRIVSENAFGESMFSILPALKSGRWQLLKSDLSTSIKYKPTMPLTAVQKQWLKAVMQDARIKLFDLKADGFEDAEPLFTKDDYVIYDKYGDGDPYDDENYIAHFRTVLKAMNEGNYVKINMTNRRGNNICVKCFPQRLEYSEKDDRFRLITSDCRFIRVVNISRIKECVICDGETGIRSDPPETEYETVTLKVSEERNTPERCMMHFAHLEKRAEKYDGYYLLHIRFDKDDETEMVIRVLSFGPTVEVVEPEGFKNLITERLKKQKSCGNL